MKKLTLIGVIAVLLCGCYTPQKAADQTHKALDKYPEVAAKIIRDQFPCVNGVVKPGDSTEYFRLQDSIKRIQEFYDNLLNSIEPEQIVTKDLSDSMKVVVLTANLVKCNERDALREKQIKELKAKVAKPVFIHDTIPVEDKANVFLAQKETEKQVKENKKLQEKNDSLEHKLGIRTKLMWLFLIIALCLTAWTFRKLFI